MSSEKKFNFVEEVEVGVLNAEQKDTWARLSMLEKQLERAQEIYEKASDSFWNDLKKQFGHLAEDPRATQTLLVSDAGVVSVGTCPCPVCQASMQGTTVLDVVERMYEDRFIPSYAIEQVRSHARALDTEKKSVKRCLN